MSTPPPRSLLVAAFLTGVLLVALQFGGDSAIRALRYTRDAVTDGEWWRLLTANLIHAGWHHLALNLAAAGLGLVMLERALTVGLWIFALLLGGLATTVGLWILAGGISWYLGASGALHGLFVAGGLVLALRRDGFGIAILAIIGAKLVWEQVAGPVPGSAESAGVPVIVDAHLYGALGGAAAAALVLAARHIRGNHAPSR